MDAPSIVVPLGEARPVTDYAGVSQRSSGDTYAFSDFLSHVSPEWKSEKGTSTQVNFGTGVGGKGDDGVAAAISRTDGALVTRRLRMRSERA